MSTPSPLLRAHLDAGAMLLPYGPLESPIEVVASFGIPAVEYAAIRKSAAILDAPFRGVIEVKGKDGPDFLNRMLTQDCRPLRPWATLRSFWLNRKGRIDSDLRVIERGAVGGDGNGGRRLLLDLDACNVQSVLQSLGSYLFGEDVELIDASQITHRFSLFGPGASDVLATASRSVAGPGINELAVGQACEIDVAGAMVVVDRHDGAGAPSYELTCAAEDAVGVYESIAAPALADEPGANAHRIPAVASGRARQIGWHAFNIARIEAGWPLFNIDFGPTNLPHETGVVTDRISFKKGCYLGQEIVARMESRKSIKQKLVALRLERSADSSDEDLPQPATASRIFATEDATSELVGGVTSSAVSPLLAQTPICFAMVKHDLAEPGTRLFVEVAAAGGSCVCLAPATVQPGLRFIQD